MKSNFGDCFQISLFGESHSDAVGVVIGGLSAGISIDFDFIEKQLSKRRPYGKISTSRVETDTLRILSGYYNNMTTGTPLCIMIENHDTQSSDYEKTVPRPSHADFTGYEKYNGNGDYRGGGHFSGRLTAPLVVAGAIATQLLFSHDIIIATHIKQLYNIEDAPFSDDEKSLEIQADLLNDSFFPTLNSDAQEKMIELIECTADEGNSLGGILETVILNVKTGLGEPFFNSIESKLSSILFSIPGVKGLEFGDGFSLCTMKGDEANDEFFIEQPDDADDTNANFTNANFTDKRIVKTKTNHNGGINGGISNGMPILFKTAIKPTPSIFLEQQSVDLSTMENVSLQIKGRHDPAIIHRARVVVDSVAAIAILDLFCERYGTEWTNMA